MFHKHKWKILSSHAVESYGDGWGNMTTLPTSFKTHLALRCSKCGDLKSKTIKGLFQLSENMNE